MISALGGIVLLMCAFSYGIERSRVEREYLLLTEALADFVMYIGQQIETFRTPLYKIYEEYSNERFEKEIFFEVLRAKGFYEALLSIRDKLPRDVFSVLEKFSRAIGAGYEKGQAELCAYTVEGLKKMILERKERYDSRMRMYRLLPLLLALSFVILLL